MDESLLKEKGFNPSSPKISFVEGYALRIGSRATLIPASGAKAYGTVMELSGEELSRLYGEESVADYIPENVTANTMDGNPLPAVAYILPEEKLSGKNIDYLYSLVEIAKRVGLPDEYICKLESLRLTSA